MVERFHQNLPPKRVNWERCYHRRRGAEGHLSASGGDLPEAETCLDAGWLLSNSGHGNRPRMGRCSLGATQVPRARPGLEGACPREGLSWWGRCPRTDGAVAPRTMPMDPLTVPKRQSPSPHLSLGNSSELGSWLEKELLINMK